MIEKLVLYLRMIKVAHSVFALPFALTAAFLAADGVPAFAQFFFIVLAMVGARSAAMGMNRIIDRRIDAANPRTTNREIPSGRIKVADALLFSLLSFGLMVFAAYMLNPLCLKLSPIAIAILTGYSLTKRFTAFSHIVLGIAISGATIGAWIAIKGSMDIAIVPLTFAVIFWLAGFDILYALQDVEFDRAHKLFSIPGRFGVPGALGIARSFHLITFVMLLMNGIVFSLGVIYFIGMFLVGSLLVYEHSLVRKDDLSRLNIAFFNMNGYISVTVFFFTVIDLIIIR